MRYPNTRRGAQPVASSDSLALFTLDTATKADIIGGRAVSTPGFTSAPSVDSGPIGNRLTFGGANFCTASAAAGDVAAFTASTWTFAAWVRCTSAPSPKMTYTSFCGNAIDPDAVENALAECSLSVVGGKLLPTLLWEYTTGNNVELIPSVAGVDLDVGVWYFIAWRRTAADTVDLLVNGVLQETFTGLTPNSDGANAYWHFGAASRGSSLANPLTGDLCGVYASTVVETDEKLLADFRRGVPMSADWDTVVHRRLLIQQQGSSDLYDMTSLQGVDWVRGVQFNDQQSAQVLPVSMRLLREFKNLSLSLLRTDSKINKADINDPLDFDPLLDAGKTFRVEWARVPHGIAPEDRDWQEKTRGQIDSIDFGGNPATVEGQDLGAVLMQRQIENVETYSGVIETVAQDIIDDNGALDTIYTRDAIGFNVTSYTPQRGPTLSALRTLYGQAAGADVRYLWDPITDTLRLTAYLPKIDNTVPAFSLSDKRVREIRRARRSRDTVRNVVEITYPDDSNLDSNGNALPATVLVEDVASIASYGRLKFVFTESQTGLIRNSTDATALANKVLQTLKDPRLGVDVGLGICPEIEVNDVALLEGDDLHWTGNQSLTVAGVSVDMPGNADDGSTTLTVAGLPSLGPPRWLDIEARPGQGRHPIRDAGDRRERFEGDLNPITSQFSTWIDLIGNGRFLQLKNYNFATFTRDPATYLPDGWALTGGTWQTDVFPDEAVQASGGRSIRFTADGQQIRTELTAVDYSLGRFLLIAIAQAHGGDPLNRFDVDVLFYDEARNFLSNSPTFSAVTSTFNAPAAQEFYRTTIGPINAPASAAYMQLRLTTNLSTVQNHWLDAVAPFYGSAECSVTLTDQSDTDAAIPVVLNTWTQVRLDTENRDWVDNFDSSAGNYFFQAPEAGLFDIEAILTAYVLDAIPQDATIDGANVRIEVDTGSGYTVAATGTGSSFADTSGVINRYEITTQLATRLRLDQGDRVRMMGKMRATLGTGGDTFGFKGGDRYTQFNVKLRSTE